jgi:glycosyltransferase involved in cell wall biosynthesis
MRSLCRWSFLFFFLWHGPRRVLSSEPVLSYGGLCLKGRAPSHGGNVKLIHLDRAFGESARGCNLLYMVSSGVSIRTEAWADICLARGVKLVWNQNGVAFPAWTEDHERLNGRMARFLTRASFVVYQSRFCRQSADALVGRPSGGSAVLYNAVDTTYFSPRSQGRGDVLRLLVMGSHENPGRVMAALEALSMLLTGGRRAQLLVAGRLAWPGALEDVDHCIKALGLQGKVLFRGPYSQAEAPGIYEQADILLHLKYADPCPSVVIEAMACGLPVIGSHSGGLPELVLEDGPPGGVLLDVPQDLKTLYLPSPDAVAGAVERVAADLGSFSGGARRRAVERFDVSLWLSRHREIFRQLL